MIRLKGKLLAILLSLVMAFTMVPMTGSPVYADDKNESWTKTDDGKAQSNGAKSVRNSAKEGTNEGQLYAVYDSKDGRLAKNKILSVGKVIRFTRKGQGKMTYSKVSGNKKIIINKKTGKLTVKKGLKKGTYKVKIKVKAAGNKKYKASAWKTVTFKLIVK